MATLGMVRRETLRRCSANGGHETPGVAAFAPSSQEPASVGLCGHLSLPVTQVQSVGAQSPVAYGRVARSPEVVLRFEAACSPNEVVNHSAGRRIDLPVTRACSLGPGATVGGAVIFPSQARPGVVLLRDPPLSPLATCSSRCDATDRRRSGEQARSARRRACASKGIGGRRVQLPGRGPLSRSVLQRASGGVRIGAPWARHHRSSGSGCSAGMGALRRTGPRDRPWPPHPGAVAGSRFVLGGA